MPTVFSQMTVIRISIIIIQCSGHKVRIEDEKILPLIKEKTDRKTQAQEMILESSIEDIAAYLTYQALGNKLHEIFGLSRLAEIAARFLHLEESEHKLEKIKKEVQLQYFRQRHELMDRNMRELFAARLAFR